MHTKTDLAVVYKIQAIHTLRVNVKSLAREARIIRQETRRAGAEYKNTLAHHRRVTVRKEARVAQLALAFVRGRRYRTVEQKSVDSNLERGELIERVIKKVTRHYWKANEAEIKKWLGEAP